MTKYLIRENIGLLLKWYLYVLKLRPLEILLGKCCHRSFSFQEFSQRYADPTTSLKHVTREARLQDTKNRQNSIEVDDNKLEQSWRAQQDLVWLQAIKAYNWAMERGIAKEQARAVLPEGLTESRLYEWHS